MLYISFVWRKKCKKNNNSPILEGGFFGCEQLPGNQRRLQEITHLNEETIWHMRCCKTLNCWFSSLIFSFFHGLFQSHISCLWWVSSDLPRGHAAQRFCWCMTCFFFFLHIHIWVCFLYIDFSFMSGNWASTEGSILREDVSTVPVQHFPSKRKVCVTDRVRSLFFWANRNISHNRKRDTQSEIWGYECECDSDATDEIMLN